MKVEKIPKNVLKKIDRIPCDTLIEKHELSGWHLGLSKPYSLEIEGKKLIFETYFKPQNLEYKSHFFSSDNLFLVAMFYHKGHEQFYVAIARWHQEADLYVTLFLHATYIANWENYTTIFTLDKA